MNLEGYTRYTQQLTNSSLWFSDFIMQGQCGAREDPRVFLCKSSISEVVSIIDLVLLRSWQTTMITASTCITSWQIDGGTIETVTKFIFLGSKITARCDYSHEIKRCLLLRRKAMTNLDSTLKSKDITLPTKVCIVKAIVFPIVMYACECWTIKKVQFDTFKSQCWRRLFESLGLQGDQISQS